ncbi:MAG TPA: thioredoxin domain-containing protein [Verrucomicrobiae bacterium]|jgi:protein-disulfide isomerase|nr:thioredoxin domain-containing protein [Verrucomicrobiae bacterium]
MAKLKVPVGPADHSQGPADAPVTLVEYGDYECSHCGRAYPIVKALQKKFGKQLRFVFRNFPLREIHPHAEAAAETAEFAANHGKFWDMHDLIFENQSSLSEQMLVELAHRLTLDRQVLRDALKSGTFAERVQGDFASGVRSGVNGTPTFFINSERHDGDFELETLLQAIQKGIHNDK